MLAPQNLLVRRIMEEWAKEWKYRKNNFEGRFLENQSIYIDSKNIDDGVANNLAIKPYGFENILRDNQSNASISRYCHFKHLKILAISSLKKILLFFQYNLWELKTSFVPMTLYVVPESDLEQCQ